MCRSSRASLLNNNKTTKQTAQGGRSREAPEGFEVGNFSAALHQELLFDYKPEIAEKLAGEFDLEDAGHIFAGDGN